MAHFPGKNRTHTFGGRPGASIGLSPGKYVDRQVIHLFSLELSCSATQAPRQRSLYTGGMWYHLHHHLMFALRNITKKRQTLLPGISKAPAILS